MTDSQIYTKLASLKPQYKTEVLHFIKFLADKEKYTTEKPQKRMAGKAKGLIKIKDNFNDPM
jgi:hypothetical protein